LGGFDVGGIAVDGNVLTASINSNVEQRLQVFDVLIVNTKQSLETTRRKLNLYQTLLTLSFTQQGHSYTDVGVRWAAKWYA
jgi:hypothetical protein